MIRTIVSIFITFALIFALSAYEMYYVHTTFDQFTEILQSLYTKTNLQTATIEDGDAMRAFWEKKKKALHVWISHTALQEVDYQMDEAIGFLYLKDYEDALPKIKVLIGIADTIPENYTFGLENIF